MISETTETRKSPTLTQSIFLHLADVVAVVGPTLVSDLFVRHT